MSDLDKVFKYDPLTGLITWNIGKKRKGKEAGCIHKTLNYRVIGYKRKTYYAHRIAWFITYGRWPTHPLDHINGDRGDNRITNLREVTATENQKNMKLFSTSSSGVVGVTKHT